MRLRYLSGMVGIALIVGLSGSVAIAQEQPAAGSPPPATASQAPPQATQTPPPPPDMQPRHAPGPQRQAKRLARRLSLTPAQQTEVASILADRQQQIQSIRADTMLAPRDRKVQVREIFRESIRKINAVLNDTQRQQYRQMRQEQRARRLQREQQQQTNGATG